MSMPLAELESQKLTELYKLAKKYQITNYGQLKKKELKVLIHLKLVELTKKKLKKKKRIRKLLKTFVKNLKKSYQMLLRTLLKYLKLTTVNLTIL